MIYGICVVFVIKCWDVIVDRCGLIIMIFGNFLVSEGSRDDCYVLLFKRIKSDYMGIPCRILRF